MLAHPSSGHHPLSVYANRYIQLLKDDRNLQLEMGLKARAAVAYRTIEYVVKDLLEWYQVGMQRRSQRSYMSTIFSVILLLISVPLAVVSFFMYNLVSFSFNHSI